jgi:hypothetical protein
MNETKKHIRLSLVNIAVRFGLVKTKLKLSLIFTARIGIEFFKQGLCHTVALPFTLKRYLKAKRRIMEIQIFHHAKMQSSKKSSKETKVLQDIITL